MHACICACLHQFLPAPVPGHCLFSLTDIYFSRTAQELIAADILCIILLVRALFPSTEKLEDLFAQSYTTTPPPTVARPQGSNGDKEKFESAFEGFTTGDEDDEEDDSKVFTILALLAGFQLSKINIGNTGNQNHPDLKV